MRVNPASWWIASAILVLTATASQSPLGFLAVAVACEATVLVLQSNQRFSWKTKSYYWFALAVLAARVGLRILFGEWPISAEHVWAALGEGMRLVAILFAVAMANQLANPKRLIRLMPESLYELGTSVVLALNLAPQLGPSLARVQRAARLRGRSKGLGAFASITTPVLEDTFEQSIKLAESMEVRGFGGANERIARRRVFRFILLLGSLLALISGTFFLVAFGLTVAAVPLVSVGCTGLVVQILLARGKARRTSYLTLSWGFGDLLVVAIALLIGTSVVLVPILGATK